MNKPHDNAPMPVLPPPAVVDEDLEPLLAEPFAQAWRRAPDAGAAQAVRSRLVGRLAASRAAEAPMVTRRRCSVPREALAPGVQAQTLYLAEPSRALRRGEPLRVRLIELAPGARWSCGDAPDRHREVLVLTGSIRLGGSPPRDAERLSLRDYHVVPAGHAWPVIESAEAGWPAFAPGIRRRVLWSRGSEAALLYHAEPGASVPLHTHGHDEECLMVQGELFLDDLLLQGGDWQLAPAGTGHHTTATDTGVVIYAHGDLDLQFVG